MVRVAALFCEGLRDRIVDCMDVAGARVLPSQTGQVTVTCVECPSFDGAAWRRDRVTVRRPDGLPADESAEARR